MAYRKVGGVPAKADVAAQAEFVETKLQPRLDKAKAGKRQVFFVDAAHFVYAPFLGYLWCVCRLFIKAPSGRQRYNVLGAVNAITHEFFRFTNCGYINAESVCELLRRIRAGTTGPITLVMDNARYQHCALVKALAKKLKIELLFLPGYSPNLNLIERVWKFVKAEVLASRYLPTFDDFQKAIDGCLADLHGKHKPRMDTLLALRFQTFENTPIWPA